MADSAASMTWRGEVTQSIFRGANRSVSVKTTAGVLSLDTASFDPPRVGSTVTVGADQMAAWVVPL
jgi:hypothetical protein